MPEHTPAPTPSRSVYGFVLYLGSKTFFFLYLIWALVPESWFETINITYLPQKYWAVAIPVFLLTILATFAFIIYPSLNLCLTPSINDIKTIEDSYTKKKKIKFDYTKNIDSNVSNSCICKSEDTCYLEKYIVSNKISKNYQIPMVEDICIAEVSKILYMK